MTPNLFFSDPTMKRALVASILMSLSGAPLGVMLVLRRMSLMGDVMAHAILPGTAAGFIVAGMSYPIMGLGGLFAGLLVALAAGLVTRFTSIREDANLTVFYLLAVALGIMMLSIHGTAKDLEDILFGDAAAIDGEMLWLIVGVTTITLILFSIIYRPLVVESFDPLFMRSMHARGGIYHIVFMMLVVLNMVSGYRVLGTLMASGLLLIPAVTAQLWSRELFFQILTAILIAVTSSIFGIYLAYIERVPSGPAIVLIAGAIYIISFAVGPHGSLRERYFPPRHLEK